MRKFEFFNAGAIFLALWFVGLIPIAAVGGGYDDYLFVRLANFVLHNQWLGPFDQLTLSKGPFFPLFLAISAAIGIPIHVSTEAV